VFGIFSKDRGLGRARDRVMNKHAQSVDRFGAMEKLGKDGSEESLLALCKRFSFKYDKTIEDQQEKQWVVDTLSTKPAAAVLPALRAYMATAQSLHYPLMILGRVATHDAALEVVDEILKAEPPGYTRDPERRTDLIAWLGEWDPGTNQEVASRSIPYLADFDENVRYKAVDTIALKPHEAAAEPLVRALIRPEEESRRLRVRIAEVLAENSWELGELKTEVAPLLEPGQQLEAFKMHRDRLERRNA
jgi:HEAT repeat protein